MRLPVGQEDETFEPGRRRRQPPCSPSHSPPNSHIVSQDQGSETRHVNQNPHIPTGGIEPSWSQFWFYSWHPSSFWEPGRVTGVRRAFARPLLTGN